MANMALLKVTNINDGEVIHQTCLLLTGICSSEEGADGHITIQNTDSLRNTSSTQAWPAAEGKWKALVLLHCGSNSVTITHGTKKLSLALTHQPLLQLPPLHLAILAAKGSPLVINCPSEKHGAFSSAHNSLDAAITKLRMSAYMWQALTAERMREAGFGRRVFRLEEEWQSDTTTLSGVRVAAKGKPSMGSVAKLHILKCEKTVEELEQMKNNSYRPQDDGVHAEFLAVLKKHGGVFRSTCEPVVAGLVLDTPRLDTHGQGLGHVGHSNRTTDGISLASFDSHFTYSWPRHLEEIASCLTDMIATDESVCGGGHTMSKDCCMSQANFLVEIMSALGANSTGHASPNSIEVATWAANFMAAEKATESEDDWDVVQDVETYDEGLRAMLRVKTSLHFRLPSDAPSAQSSSMPAAITVQAPISEEGVEEQPVAVSVSSHAGLASVFFENGPSKKRHDLHAENRTETILVESLAGYDRKLPLKIVALDMAGTVKTMQDYWKISQGVPFVKFSAGQQPLRLQSFPFTESKNNGNDEEHGTAWTILLHKRSSVGDLVRATAIDLRVGCMFDGIVMYYADSTTQNSGSQGGHASEKGSLPPGARIVKVELSNAHGTLRGIRMTLDNGTQWGALCEEHEHLYADGEGSDDGRHDRYRVVVLEPGDGEKIIGFSGCSDPYVQSFGIITAPIDVDVSDISVQTV